MNTEPAPTLSQTLEFISQHTHAAALREILGIRIIRRHTRSLKVGEGTPLYINIDKLHSGKFVILSDDRDLARIPLQKPDPRRPGRFELLEQHIRDTAFHTIMMGTQAFLGIRPEPRPNLVHQERQEGLLKIQSSKQVRQAAIKQSDLAVRQHPDFQGPDTPADRAYQLLREFVTPAKADLTIRIAGDNATLHHLIIMQDHLDELTKQAESYPNETLLWAQSAITPPHSKLAPPAKASIARATSAFIHEAETSSSDNLRITLHSLDRQALRKFPELRPRDLAIIARHITGAGVQPSPQATEYLLENPHIYTNTPPGLIRSFIRESAKLPQTPHAQERLTAQMTILQRYATPHHPKRKNPWNTGSLNQVLGPYHWTSNHTPPWNDLVSIMPEWTTGVDSRSDLPNHKQDFPTPRAVNPHLYRLTYALNPTHVRETLRLKASNPLSFHSIKGARTILTGPHLTRPHLLIEKHPDGRITFQTAQGQIASAAIRPYVPKDKHTRDIALTGIAPIFKQTVDHILHTTIVQRWKQWNQYPNCRPPTYAVTEQATGPQTANILPDATQSASEAIKDLGAVMNADVAALTDPTTWNTAKELCHPLPDPPNDHLTPFQYNAVATIGHQLMDTNLTNPGAIVMGFTFLQDPEPLRHPGQFIALTRKFMESEGLDPANWKFAATMNRHTMASLASPGHLPHHLTKALNILARTQSIPAPGMAEFITNRAITHLRPNPRATPEQADVSDHNQQVFITLLAKESQRLLREQPEDPSQQSLQQQANNALDYALHLTEQATRIHSTAWKTIVRNSDRWHYDRRRTNRHPDLIRALERRRQSADQPQSWTSALPATRICDYDVIPLTDEDQLIEESLLTGHCVFRYTHACVEGARLFSIRKNKTVIATAELNLRYDQWKTVQASGPENGPLTQETQDVANSIADAYTKAWSLQQETQA